MRLHGWDYSSPSCYFVTIYVKNKECFLADMVDDEIVPSEYGKIVEYRWEWLKTQYSYVNLDAFVVMPNHVHGLIRLQGESVGTGRDLSRNDLAKNHGQGSVGTGRDLSRNDLAKNHGQGSVGTGRDLSLPMIPEKIKSLSDIIGAFKMTSSKDIHLAGFPNFYWQRSFYEKIIRSEQEANVVRQYIKENPSNWDRDDENPGKIIHKVGSDGSVKNS